MGQMTNDGERTISFELFREEDIYCFYIKGKASPAPGIAEGDVLLVPMHVCRIEKEVYPPDDDEEAVRPYWIVSGHAIRGDGRCQIDAGRTELIQTCSVSVGLIKRGKERIERTVEIGLEPGEDTYRFFTAFDAPRPAHEGDMLLVPMYVDKIAHHADCVLLTALVVAELPPDDPESDYRYADVLVVSRRQVLDVYIDRPEAELARRLNLRRAWKP